ncbi:hypothetical protein BJF79_13600 [Actinomadura sp. CNU-125]|uniref:hypothetical protein n=1 Tax=Actinomadura sp. CNU-125 TaxID=1904961 RepID=UPI00095ADA9F|nr:hypothetical protein [Actinomadura sp. CNU-125]OLT24372.1 hypothetical protein BJF79_13600 [Actinomadura sp. CNU-125]
MTNQPKPKPATAAETIRELLGQLHGEIITREKVPRYRQVRRSQDRTVAVLDWATHVTKEPGLLAQLGVTNRRAAAVPVEVRRWQPDPCPCNEPERVERRGRVKCWHGRWVLHRVEQRVVEGVASAGAAIPSGSPGWDADGALSPLIGGSPDPGEPVTEAWHAADEIRRDLDELGHALADQGWKAPATLVTIALEDEDTGKWIASRLRAIVGRARIAADYDAPMVPLRDVYCPDCGGPLKVRADASSAVWCDGWVPVHGPAAADDPDWPADSEEWGPVGQARCGASWPRGSWVRLLEEAEREAG